jgi:hypothetical protein
MAPRKPLKPITTLLSNTAVEQKAQQRYAKKLLALLGDLDLWVRVWKGASGEVRVYVNHGRPLEKNSRQLVCYYLTGNARTPPKTMMESEWFVNTNDTTCKAVRQLCDEMANEWITTKFSCQQAVNR